MQGGGLHELNEDIWMFTHNIETFELVRSYFFN